MNQEEQLQILQGKWKAEESKEKDEISISGEVATDIAGTEVKLQWDDSDNFLAIPAGIGYAQSPLVIIDSDSIEITSTVTGSGGNSAKSIYRRID